MHVGFEIVMAVIVKRVLPIFKAPSLYSAYVTKPVSEPAHFSPEDKGSMFCQTLCHNPKDHRPIILCIYVEYKWNFDLVTNL
jgi:hypothetical protein